MIAAWLTAVALAAPVGLERVDLLSEDSPTWLVDELPRTGTTPRVVTVRWVEQVAPVWFTPIEGLTVSTSLRTQAVRLERPLVRAARLYGEGAVLTRLGLPSGARVGLAVHAGPFRIGASMAAVSATTWARPDWSHWRVLPALGLGVGRAVDPPPRAPWAD